MHSDAEITEHRKETHSNSKWMYKLWQQLALWQPSNSSLNL
jgi:hypothetical protein